MHASANPSGKWVHVFAWWLVRFVVHVKFGALRIDEKRIAFLTSTLALHNLFGSIKLYFKNIPHR
jgi:hypothetical protein